ncbi:MAG: hypothetical protein WCA82_14580 [Jiangellales bacterium]
MTPGRVLVAIGVVVALAVMAFVAHRGLLAMERRGWVYYRAKGTGSMGASAMFGLNEAFHPEARHTVIEQAQSEQRGPRRAAPGDPPSDPD